MSSRYEVQMPLNKARLKNFIALDNLTAQTPLIELVRMGRKRYVRIWTAYDYGRVKGTYTAIYPDGLVSTVTIYPGGRVTAKTNREADK